MPQDLANVETQVQSASFQPVSDASCICLFVLSSCNVYLSIVYVVLYLVM